MAIQLVRVEDQRLLRLQRVYWLTYEKVNLHDVSLAEQTEVCPFVLGL